MRTIFIGDVHGCHVEFQALLDATAYARGSDRLLLTGDAFSRGPGPVQVWDMIRENDAQMVLGNHDDRLLKRLRRSLRGLPPDIRKPHQQYAVDRMLPIADALIPWLEARPLWIRTPDFLLVHAGINPEQGFEGTTRHEFLSIRTWPPTGYIFGTRWHDHYTPGSLDARLVVFGHDAPGGLVVKRRKDGRPYLVGLDSGCVYGFKLSAYILEEDRIVQVDSRQKHFRLS